MERSICVCVCVCKCVISVDDTFYVLNAILCTVCLCVCVCWDVNTWHCSGYFVLGALYSVYCVRFTVPGSVRIRGLNDDVVTIAGSYFNHLRKIVVMRATCACVCVCGCVCVCVCLYVYKFYNYSQY